MEAGEKARCCRHRAPATRELGWLALITCYVFAACIRYDGMVTVVPGSTAQHLILDFGASNQNTVLPAVDAIVVEGGPFNIPKRYSAPGTYTWFVVRSKGTPPSAARLAQIRYGAVPSGFQQSAPPLPLLRGHYHVEVRAGKERAKGSFVIDSEGVAWPSPM